MPRRTDKFRGSRTHGRGKKAGRGAGKRGGRGNAGLHKHRHTTMIKNGIVWGRHGFNKDPGTIIRNKAINLWQLERDADRWVGDGKAQLKKGVYTVDLQALGYDKLLGYGKVLRKFNVTVASGTGAAVRKIEAAGGSVSVANDE